VGTKKKLFGLAVLGTAAALLAKMFGKKSATKAGGARVPPVAEESADSCSGPLAVCEPVLFISEVRTARL